MSSGKSEKKIKHFLYIKDTCNTLLLSVHEENTDFVNLAEKASPFDKEELKKSLNKLEQKFEDLENEYSSIVNNITKAQDETCQDSITEIRNNLTSLKKDIKTSLRTYEPLSTPSGILAPTIIHKSNKLNKTFEPKLLKHNAKYSTYVQWRDDMFRHFNINDLFKEEISTQRAHLLQLLDTELRASIDSEAPNHDTFALGPTLTQEQKSSVEKGNAYPVPVFPVPNTCLIGILDAHFNRQEPKMMRLFNYNKACMEGQFQNEGWYEAWTRLDQMYQTSGIASMSKEEYRKMTCITMTSESALRQKLLQQGQEKSLQDLLAIGQAWQAGSSLNSKIEQKNTATAYQISTENEKSCCKFCGFSHGSYCPASSRQCKNCDKVGHFAKMCPNSHPHQGLTTKVEDLMKELKSLKEEISAKKLKKD